MNGEILTEHNAQPAARLVGNPHKGGFYLRTFGAPSSMRNLFDDFGLEIKEAAAFFDIEPAYICAVIGIEATRLPNGRFDSHCCREEPGFAGDNVVVYRDGRTKAGPSNKVSPGLMQTLLSTYKLTEPRIAPLIPGGLGHDRHDLFNARRSILSGAAYMAMQREKYGDPIKSFVGAYNAGGVYSASNVFNLRTYSDTRVERFIAFFNDAVSIGI